MRHQNKTIKLGRSQAHRDALLANQVCSLIEHSRIKTTLAKAKAVRPFAEKIVTLGKSGTLHARRRAAALLGNNSEYAAVVVKKLFAEVAPRCVDRRGGYTRIIKLGQRKSDSAPMALLEWVDLPLGEDEAETPKAEAKGKKAKAEPEKAAEEKPARKPRAKKAPAEKSEE